MFKARGLSLGGAVAFICNRLWLLCKIMVTFLHKPFAQDGGVLHHVFHSEGVEGALVDALYRSGVLLVV